MIPVGAQFYALVAMILFGVVMGAAFDIYREVRNTFRFKPMSTNIGDLLVWLLLVALAFAVLLYINQGEVRLYVFLGMALGLLAYFRFISGMAQKPIQVLLYIFFKTASLLWTVFRIPFSFLQRVLIFPANLLSLLLFKLIFPFKKLFKFFSRPPKLKE
ncbi:MAG: spore cortex biosynthesis protein YabQ [Bacillota bacterium]|jgi:spore cortex biosynthesis protein YabQ